MPDPQKKLVQVNGLGVIEFPGGMQDDQIAATIKRHKAQTHSSSPHFTGKSTEESEKARQLKPAQPLSTAIPHLPQWANTPVLSGLTFDAQIERAEKSGHPEQAEWLRKQKSLQDKAYEKNKAKHPIATGIGTGVGEFAEGMTSPANLALIAGAPESKLLSGLFAIQALNGSYKDAGAARDAYLKGNNAEAAKYATEAALGLGIAGLAGHHAVKDIPVPEPVRKFVADETGSVTNPLAPKIPDVKAKAAELKPTTAYKSADESQPFYLKSENLINEKMKGPMPAEDVHKMLLSNGVKPEEMKWTGLDELLQGKGKQKVTPQEIQEHLAGNNLQVQEVQLGGPKPMYKKEELSLNQKESSNNAVWVIDAPGQVFQISKTRYPNPQDAIDYIVANKTRSDAKFGSEPKFGTYTLPGAEPGSYRELLVTMPPKTVTQHFLAYKGGPTIGQGYANLTEAQSEMADLFPNRDDIEIRQGRGDRSTTTRTPDNFRSNHWDEPNPASHVRFDDRTGPNGEKILFIEEAQDDWAQKGRKEGYKRPNRVPTKATRHDGYWEVHDQDGNFITNIQDWQHPEITNEEQVLKEA